MKKLVYYLAAVAKSDLPTEDKGALYDIIYALEEKRRHEIRPATKFLGNSPFKQLCHITSEVYEIWIAWLFYKVAPDFYTFDDLMCELVDAQGSIQTAMQGPFGLSDKDVNHYRAKVVKKNDAPGRKYYSEGGSGND